MKPRMKPSFRTLMRAESPCYSPPASLHSHNSTKSKEFLTWGTFSLPISLAHLSSTIQEPAPTREYQA